MPTPREAYSNTVDRQGYSGARMQAADYGAAGEIMGRAVQGAGQALTKVGEDLDQIQTIYATAAAKDADAQAALKLQAIGNSYSLLEQGDAIAGKEKALADIDALEKEMAGTLKDKRAQRMFADVFRQRKTAVLGNIQEHEGKEVLKYADAKSEARQNASATVAIDAPDEESMFLNIETAINERWSRMRGAADEDKAFEAYKLRSNILARRAQTIRDPIAQEQFRAKHAGMISPEDELVIVRANAPGLADAQAAFASENFAAWRAGGRDPSIIQSPTSPVTQIDDATGAEVPGEGIVEIAVPPSRAAEDMPESATSRLASPRAVTAVVKGSNYNPVRGIGRISQTVQQHHARGGGTGRVAIDYAAPAGTAIYPPVRGKVVEVGHSSGNGNYIRVDYGDGVVGTYLHLKTPPPVGKDSIVDTSSVIGLVGNTGHSRGNHLDYSVKVNGQVVDPNKVAYRGHNGDGESRAAISEMEQFKPDDADTTTLVADIHAYAKAAGLSRVQERQLLRDQMEIVNFNRGLKDDKERQADEGVDEWLLAHGDAPFKLSDVPGYTQASTAKRSSIAALQEQRSRPKPIEANGEPVTDMEILAVEDPDTFITKDLDSIPMTTAERASLKVKQATIRKSMQNGGAGEVDTLSKVRAAADVYVYRLPGITGNVDTPPEKNIRLAYYQHMQRLIAVRTQEKGKALTPTEIDNLAAEAAMTVLVNDKKVPLFQAPKGGTVRMGRIDAMKIAWRAEHPDQPLPSDAWFAQQAQGR